MRGLPKLSFIRAVEFISMISKTKSYADTSLSLFFSLTGFAKRYGGRSAGAHAARLLLATIAQRGRSEGLVREDKQLA